MSAQLLFVVIDLQTGREADEEVIALREDWTEGLIYCDMEGFAIGADGTLYLLDECGKQVECPHGRFEIIWSDGRRMKP